MRKGNGLFLILLILAILAEALDHSSSPILFTIANIYEVFICIAGTWKLLELFNGWFKQ